MIIFHEGMPGSGKSFAAMKDHIIPALQKGRKVYCRMNGLDREKIAELSGRTQDEIQQQLFGIDENQVSTVYLYIEKDSLIVIDELQNFFPRSRGQLTPEMTKFIAEHRHQGLDILCMGQLLKDCHGTWINRVNRKIQFLNKDVLGKPDEYKWKMFNGTPDDKGNVRFVEVTAGSSSYDPKYFGSYASFKQDTENTERLSDTRAVIWNNPVFKKWLPILGVALVAALGYVGYLFNGGLSAAPKQTASTPATSSQVKPVSAVTETYKDGKLLTRTTEGKAKEEPETPKATEQEWPDPVIDNSKDKRIRVALVMRTAKQTKVIIEWRDQGMQIYDQLSGEQLKILGWSVLVGADDQTVLLNKGDKRMFATAWPVSQPVSKVTDGQQEQIKAESKMMGQAPSPIAMLQ